MEKPEGVELQGNFCAAPVHGRSYTDNVADDPGTGRNSSGGQRNILHDPGGDHLPGRTLA